MKAFILRRLLLLIPMLFGASLVIFLMLRLGPSDPALDYLRLSKLPPTPQALADAREMLGLDRPLATQYLDWIGRALRGDFGTSYALQRPVLPDILHFLPATMQLAGTALAFTLLVSVPLGIWAARYRDRWPDHAVRLVAFLGVSVPNFWLGFLLVLVFSVHLGWLPPMGREGPASLVMPVIAVALMSLAVNARLLRASMLEVAGQRHVRYARLRGLPPRMVERRHVLRNAWLPVITATGMHIGELLGGTLVIESIFGWPGLGRYAVSAILNRDYPVIQCFTLLMVVIFVLCNLIVDILYALADPRIRQATQAPQ
ncbi:nickel ABC transporter permease subunit NikB [Rhodovulum sulfidophilum]|uniref:Nickel ABC transporter permease subunit NikB n=1 Tax=Rhodovulum sulfidophilum TaxID=35806 RepID=A0A0D6B7P1_RHOSU|nr:nickel ABC transporter permease subunit NikB [Rhodovulum sulfidophilum]ANB33120.1 nickel ABC transporter permease subunit NikB [Rhodovulum sulfidophilum DSM 1374]ANB36968.1 nickel ABC transporter permease subunit NikB [Rhodovulum sulfidophilum]MBK5925282.1 nickel ABC transporter permease subunit NikB [Rhodovulum sulfidophilum]MBL3559802.1 nickel ABC transporter permease subunit NikB [Rhodovulum sulfidophilum]MBL3563943.1 nickel ABC transporter permease subunit NikB [Rhodovulum sulfidophilum